MIKINEKLNVLHDKNGVFSDLSNDLSSFQRDEAQIEFTSNEDKIYIGFYKPINVFYVEFNNPNINATSLSLNYFNGSSFTEATGFNDDTKGFTRSGFINFERNLLNEESTTVNGVEKFWYELDFSSSTSIMDIIGLNIVFSDDQDLKRELYEVDKYLPMGSGSHILSHVSARDEIIQTLNIIGKEKINVETGWGQDITAFDLMEISEVKLASTYLVLSKIMFSASDSTEDVYSQKSSRYETLAMNIVNSTRLNVDLNDDGNKSPIEADVSFGGEIKRK